MDNSHEGLLSEFPPHSRADWEKKIAGDCQGIDIEKELFWQTNETIRVKPFYCAGDIASLDYLRDYPLKFAPSGAENGWKIRQDIKVTDFKESGDKASWLTENGVDSPGFDIRGLNPGVQDYLNLLQGIDLNRFQVHWTVEEKYLKEHLSALIRSGNHNIPGSSCTDPLGNMLAKGAKEPETSEYYTDFIRIAISELPFMKVLSVGGYALQNAGAGIVQELAWTLSMAASYISDFADKGIAPDQILSRMQIDFGISCNYFFEIAKLRAARILWAAMISEFGVEAADHPVHIQSTTSLWNKTVYESHVNILRSVTEAMSAISGGCDTIRIYGYDHCYRSSGDHSMRIARNIPVILREESGFGKVADPASGSYYIEHLTDEICNVAWDLFLETEKQGGFLSAWKKGIISAEIEKTAKKRLEMAATGTEIILGTNLFPYPPEKMWNNIETEQTFTNRRAASEFENLRLAMEKHEGRKPAVFLLQYGNPAWRSARSQFSTNFFTAGGYEIIPASPFRSPGEGFAEAVRKDADIVVLCSSDDEYEIMVKEMKPYAGGKMIFVIAGAPASMADLKEQGITGFIYTGINMVETLTGFHKRMGIKLSY